MSAAGGFWHCPRQGLLGQTVIRKKPGQRCSGDVFVQVSYETMRLYEILQGILHGHTKRNTTWNTYMEYYQVCWGFPKAIAGSCSKPCRMLFKVSKATSQVQVCKRVSFLGQPRASVLATATRA